MQFEVYARREGARSEGAQWGRAAASAVSLSCALILAVYLIAMPGSSSDSSSQSLSQSRQALDWSVPRKLRSLAQDHDDRNDLARILRDGQSAMKDRESHVNGGEKSFRKAALQDEKVTT